MSGPRDQGAPGSPGGPPWTWSGGPHTRRPPDSRPPPAPVPGPRAGPAAWPTAGAPRAPPAAVAVSRAGWPGWLPGQSAHDVFDHPRGTTSDGNIQTAVCRFTGYWGGAVIAGSERRNQSTSV